jgi:hypothetical protein
MCHRALICHQQTALARAISDSGAFSFWRFLVLALSRCGAFSFWPFSFWRFLVSALSHSGYFASLAVAPRRLPS